VSWVCIYVCNVQYQSKEVVTSQVKVSPEYILLHNYKRKHISGNQGKLAYSFYMFGKNEEEKRIQVKLYGHVFSINVTGHLIYGFF